MSRKFFSISALPPRPKTAISGPTLTQQHFAPSCDINIIVGRYIKTGILVDPIDVNPGRTPAFLDFSPGVYEDFCERQSALNDYFDKLPSSVKNLCENDTAIFINKIHGDEEFVSYLQTLGIVESEKLDVEPVPPPSEDEKTKVIAD